MKTKHEVLAVHKTYGKAEGQPLAQTTLYVSDGVIVTVVKEKEFEKWITSLKQGSSLRLTAVHASDPLLLDLMNRKIQILYVNWHATGIEKGLAPEEIAKQYALLPLSVFREFTPRTDLTELRYRLSQRMALVESRKAATLRLKGAARHYGQMDKEDYGADTLSLLKDVDEIDIQVPITTKGKTKNVSLDTYIASLAKRIPECVKFNEAAHIGDSWITAAMVVAFSGGLDRFDSVASFWHYCGEHVVDGQAPKRKKGQAVTWSPKLRTTLWQMSSSIMKNRSNPWRKFFEETREQEIDTHSEKHPGCKTVDGHCTARSLRKMRKEILKQFFLSVRGVEYLKKHNPLKLIPRSMIKNTIM